MDWLKLLYLLRKLPLGNLWDYPKNITDSVACQEWALAVLESLGVLAEITDAELDDEIIGTIENLVRNNDVWDLLHGLLIEIVTEECSPGEFPFILTAENAIIIPSPIEKLANNRGFNPMIIMIIVQAVSLLLRLLKSRK